MKNVNKKSFSLILGVALFNLSYSQNLNNQTHLKDGIETYNSDNSGQSFQLRSNQGWKAPDPDLSFKFSEVGSADGGYDAKISIYTSSPDYKIRKPIFILDGFDPGNRRSIHCDLGSDIDQRGLYHLANGQQNIKNPFYDSSELESQNLIDDVRAKCYDVIFIDWTIGDGDIRKNAKLFEKILIYFNSIKTTGQPNVIMGPSMGGLVARYALADMEQKELNHDCRLFISLDTPHKGANVPLSIQQVITRLKSHNADNVIDNLGEKVYAINSIAARQMLVYHHYMTHYYPNVKGAFPTIEFNEFFKELEGLNNGKGWPEKCKMISISNGKGKYNGKLFANTAKMVRHIQKLSGFTSVKIEAYPVSNPDGKLSDMYLPGLIEKFHLTNIGMEIDNAPGGLLNAPYTLNVTGLNSEASPINHSCFIPIASAFGVDLNNGSLHKTWNSNENFEGLEISKQELNQLGVKSPFDYCFVQKKNQEHIFIGRDTKGFIFKHLNDLVSEDVFVPFNQSIDHVFDSRKNDARTIIYAGKNPVRELKVTPGSYLEGNASELIKWMPGFSVFKGGEHVSRIVPSLSTCSFSPDIPFNFKSYESFIDPSEGEKELQNESQLSKIVAYPNPTTDVLNLSFESDDMIGSTFSIVDINGRVVLNRKLTERVEQIDVSAYEAGLYFIQIHTSNFHSRLKFIKK